MFDENFYTRSKKAVLRSGLSNNDPFYCYQEGQTYKVFSTLFAKQVLLCTQEKRYGHLTIALRITYKHSVYWSFHLDLLPHNPF